jgi:hypothetical protein
MLLAGRISIRALGGCVIINMTDKSKTRPLGITALSLFFFFGAAMSFLSSILLLFPGGFLEPLWKLNPRARENFTAMGIWAIVLMFVVCVACLLAALSLWRGSWWGYWLAVALLIINLLGDVANIILGTEPRAAVGIPIVVLILTFLMNRRVKQFFVISNGG